MQLSDLLTPDHVKVPLASRTKDDVLRELVEVAAREYGEAVEQAMLAAVREREQVLSTGIGGGIAIPHGKTTVVDHLIVVAGVAETPIDFDALDAKPVSLFFLLVGPESASGVLVKALSRISRLLRREALRESLRASTSSEDFLRSLSGSEVA